MSDKYTLIAEPQTWGELKRAISGYQEDEPIHWINQPTQGLFARHNPDGGLPIVGFQNLVADFPLRWRPIETAPHDGTYVIVGGPSGYIGTPMRAEVCRYDANFRPLSPWVTHANDSFTDGGPQCTHWIPLPELSK